MAKHPLSIVELSPPEGWHDASIVQFVAPEGLGFRANVLVTQEQAREEDLGAFVDRQHAELAAAMPDYSRESLEQTTVSGLKALRVAYTFTSQDGTPVRQDAVYVLREGTAYALVMTSEETALDKVRALFDWVLASFKLGAS